MGMEEMAGDLLLCRPDTRPVRSGFGMLGNTETASGTEARIGNDIAGERLARLGVVDRYHDCLKNPRNC